MPPIRGGGSGSGAQDGEPPAESRGRRLDVHDPHPGRWAELPASDVVRRVTESDSGGVLRWRRRPATTPVLRIEDRFLTGTFDLRAVEFPYLLEFVRCRFEHTPDLRQAKLAGLEFEGCWLPGLSLKNLRSDNDLMLVESVVHGGTVELSDADIQGSLVLRDTRLTNDGGRALHGDRLSLAGALLANNLVARGEVRLSGLRTGGNVNFSGAELTNPGGNALNGDGLHAGGSLVLGVDVNSERRFTSTGRLYLPSAVVDSDFSLRGARLLPRDVVPVDEPGADDPGHDSAAALIADRIRVEGNLTMDRGLHSTGTLRVVNGRVGGSLRMSSANVDVTEDVAPPWSKRALHLDGTEVRGDFDARSLRISGQARMIDVVIQGSVRIDGANLRNPEGDAILGRRLTVGGNFDSRFVEAAGCFSLQGAKIGANLDLRGTRLVEPGKHVRTGAVLPSVDLRAATIARDLICAAGHRPFAAHGGVRMHRAEIGREATFDGAVLGSRLGGTALNAHGVVVQELVLTVGQAPRGRVNLRHARCVSLEDNEKFWNSTGRIELDDFRYESLAEPIEVRDDDKVKQRLRWMRQAMQGRYSPGPYDLLAAVFRSSGNEEHASTVLIEKHRRRYVAMAEGYRVLSPGVLLWSWLQRWMVGYGYRPIRALVWLLVCLVGGSLFFGLLLPYQPKPINAEDTLVWNPFLYTLDLIVPIVDFGNKNKWQMPGAPQWISAALIVTGWILATTAAAGVTRMLRRN